MDSEIMTTSTPDAGSTASANNGLGFNDWRTWAKVAGLLGQTAGKTIRAGFGQSNPFDQKEEGSWQKYGQKMGEYFADKLKKDKDEESEEEEQTEDFTYGD